MEVSNNILSGMGGDYDGDVLNLIALFSHEQYEQFKRLDPTYQVISNNDGRFNRTYGQSKDTKLSTYLLNHNLGEEIETEVID